MPHLLGRSLVVRTNGRARTNQGREGDKQPDHLAQQSDKGKGTDYNQYAYKVCCIHCEHIYGANGSDMHERKCPECQGGEPGIPF